MPCKISKINEVDSSNREEKPQETNLGEDFGHFKAFNAESEIKGIINRMEEGYIRKSELLGLKIKELNETIEILKDRLINREKALAIAKRIIKGRDVPL